MSALAGTLSERLLILHRNPARDDLGGSIGGWTAQASIWAAISPDGTGAAEPGDRRAAPSRWLATVRPGAAIAVGDRVRWNGVTMAVVRIEHDPATPDRIALQLEELE